MANPIFPRATRALILIFAVGIGSLQAQAQSDEVQKIRLLESEIPQESVVPLLDNPAAVLKKKLSFAKRWEMGASLNFALDEAFYTKTNFAGQILYHTSENNAYGVRYRSMSSQLSDYSRQFEKSRSNLLLGRAPKPISQIMLTNEHLLMYGKISYAKEGTMPVVFRSLFDLGAGVFESRTLPLMAAGLDASMYFAQRNRLSMGLRTVLQEIPNPLSADLHGASSTTPANPVPTTADFTNRWDLSYHLDLTFSVLF